METILYFLFGIFFIGTIFFSILYGIELGKHRKTKNILSETTNNLSKTEDKYYIIFKSFNDLKNDLIENKRNGYYEETVTLVSEEDRKANITGEPYKAYVYVTETDRYTNGMSRIKLNNIEVVSGFSPSSYEWVKTTLKSKFSSLIESKNVTWLESETDIVQQRSMKITAILDKMKEK